MDYEDEGEGAMSEKEARASVLKEMVRESHGISRSKGWYEDKDGQPIERNIPEMLCLIHSEVSEALEDYRRAGPHPVEWFEKDGTMAAADDEEKDLILASAGWKPCGFPSEMADILIRLCDLAGYLGVDLARAYGVKTAFNRTRPHRHGGKLA